MDQHINFIFFVVFIGMFSAKNGLMDIWGGYSGYIAESDGFYQEFVITRF